MVMPTMEKAVVRRTDQVTTTLLRSVATKSRATEVWVEPRVEVKNGDVVEIVRREPDIGFAWVRTDTGAAGYLQAAYLQPQ